MNWMLLIAGVLFVVWPLQYRRQMAKIERRLGERGGDPDGFHQHMDRGWIRFALIAAPVAGILMIVDALLG